MPVPDQVRDDKNIVETPDSIGINLHPVLAIYEVDINRVRLSSFPPLNFEKHPFSTV